MSRVRHRQPVWTWSVVLLSALLLPPVAARTLLYAVVQHLPEARSEVNREVGPAPRRLSEDDNDALASAESDTTDEVNLDPVATGEHVSVPVSGQDTPTVAVRLASYHVEIVSDSILLTPPPPVGTVPLRGKVAFSPASPRAPPV